MSQKSGTQNFIAAMTLAHLVSLAACSEERSEVSSAKLATNTDVSLWTGLSNTVPVCYETSGYDREKKIMRDALAGSWELHANVTFTGFDACPTSGDARHVRVRIVAQGDDNSGGGGSARLGTAALSRAADDNPGVNLSFKPDGTADKGRVEYIAVHEFGHVLGFIHEQDAPGNEGPGKCATSGQDPKVRAYTGYDRDSVMNYCNRDGNMTGNLTDADIRGVQAAYGARRQNTPHKNSCQSVPRRGLVTLGAAWNDQGQASVAIFPNDGSKFLYHSQWSIREGGWIDAAKWAAGDYNGDGRTDFAAVWNNGGQNVLTLRRSTGSSFIGEHWAVNVGGWMDSTFWLPGDYNGDGLTDLAGVWNDGGLLSIAVFPSDGVKFLYPTQWSVRDGGFIDAAKFSVGDFNGDGRTDIAAAWNNGGRTTLTLRVANADSTFTHVHWSVDAGRWSDSSVFLAGDYDGNGRADIAELWNDLGQNSIKVSLSNGTSFDAPVKWATRDGGFPPSVKWVPGDFNGDGRTDIAAVWEYFGGNILTVRTSSGNSFSPAHWSTNAGGWIESTAWCAGAF